MEEPIKTKESINFLYESGRTANTREGFLDNLNQALKMARKTEDKSLETKILTTLAGGSIHNGDLQQFRSITIVILSILEEINEPILEIDVFSSLAKPLADIGNFTESNIWYQKALVVAKKYNQYDSSVKILTIIGIQLQEIPTISGLEQRQMLEKSNKYFKEALKIANENNLLKERKSMLLNNIGNIYLNIGYYDLALQNLNIALEMAEEIRDNNLIENINSNLQILQSNESKAFTQIPMQSLTLDDESANEIFNSKPSSNLLRAEDLMTLGVYWEKKGSFEKAKQCFEESVNIFRIEKSSHGLFSALSNLSGLLVENMDDMKESEKHALEALDIARNTPTNEVSESNILLLLGKIAAETGDNEKAELYVSQIKPEHLQLFVKNKQTKA